MRSVDQKVIGTVIWSFVGQECLAKLNRFMGIVSPECRFSTKCSVFIWEHSWRGQKSHSGWIWSKFQKFSESTHKNQQPLTINRLVYILVYIIRKNSTEVSSCRNTRLSTRFWPQKRVTSHKNTQNCQKRTKVVGIGPKTEPCGEPSNVDKSRVFLKKP